MCKIISVTNRHLTDNFLERIKVLSELQIPIILREKDLSQDEYKHLACEVLKIHDNVILHTFEGLSDRIHLPLNLLKRIDVSLYNVVGASVHSVCEARLAQDLGATYITAGHIFSTDCKKDLPPRGISFLEDVCKAVNIPVFAIGGITSDNINEVINAGAKGACVMSQFMKCHDIKIEYEKYKKALRTD